jgi:hypothetical protein
MLKNKWFSNPKFFLRGFEKYSKDIKRNTRKNVLKKFSKDELRVIE